MKTVHTFHRGGVARVIALCGSLIVAGCSEKPPENMVSNAKLETPTLPESWQFVAQPDDGWEYEIVSDGPGGGNAVKIHGEGERAILLLDPVPFDRGQEIRVHLKTRRDSDAKTLPPMAVKLDYFDPANTYLETATSQTLGVTGESDSWQTVAFDIETSDAPVTATSVRMSIVVREKGTALLADFDMNVLDTDPDTRPLLRNGGFEEVAGDQLIGWKAVSPKDAKAQVSWDGENPFAGRGCLQISGSADWFVVSSEPIEITPGATYRLQASGHRAHGQAAVKFDYYDGKEHIGFNSAKIPYTGAWGQVQLETDPVKLAQATHFKVCAVGRGGKIEAWFDDFQLDTVD